MKKLSLNKVNLTSLDKTQMGVVRGGSYNPNCGTVPIDTVDYCDSNGCPSIGCPSVGCSFDCPPNTGSRNCPSVVICIPE